MKRFKQTTKKQKNQARRRLFLVLSITTSFLIVVCIALYFIFIVDKTMRFISPLPRTLGASHIDSQNLEELLHKDNIQFQTADLASNGIYYIKFITGEEAYLSSQKDLASQVASLQLIVTRLTMEGKRFKKLDLRFEKPVVTF